MESVLSTDRFSDLPDSVITHILSFLRTKVSVRTSILARRWRYLWSYVPTLNFKFSVYEVTHCVNQDTLNRVMLQYKAEIMNSFSLYCEFNTSAYQLETWVIFAVKRHVQKLNRSFSFGVDLPPCIFTCKTLVDLRVDFNGVTPPTSGPVCLPCLKKLHLCCSSQYEPDEYLPHILSGCPVLEELTINIFTVFVSCTISSPIIKSLTVDFDYKTSSKSNYNHDYKLVINTPALTYLNVVDWSCQSIKSGSLTSLIEADIELQNSDEMHDHFLYSRSLVEFIDMLRNVKRLRLNLQCYPEIISSVFSASMAIRFRNLIKLELTGHSWFLSKFLQNADNLEILILKEVGEGTKAWNWIEPEQVPTCLLSHLRIIRLCGDVESELVFNIVRYILKNGKVMERIEIPYGRLSLSLSHCTPKQKINMFEKISQFRERSSACEVALIS
ncbi:hypothetical protein ABFS82_13G077400 [Erythranthe guttata]